MKAGAGNKESVRILIAEDEGRLAELIARALREDGHSVEVVHEGIDAVTHARAGPWDLHPRRSLFYRLWRICGVGGVGAGDVPAAV